MIFALACIHASDLSNPVEMTLPDIVLDTRIECEPASVSLQKLEPFFIGMSVSDLVFALGEPKLGTIPEHLSWCLDAGRLWNSQDTTFKAYTPQEACLTVAWSELTSWEVSSVARGVWAGFTGESESYLDSFEESSTVGVVVKQRIVTRAQFEQESLYGEVCKESYARPLPGKPLDLPVSCDPHGWDCADGSYVGRLRSEWVPTHLYESTKPGYLMARDETQCFLIRISDMCVGE